MKTSVKPSIQPEAVTIARAMMASAHIRKAVDQCIDRCELHRNLRDGIAGDIGEFWAASVFARAMASNAAFAESVSLWFAERKERQRQNDRRYQNEMAKEYYQKRKAYHQARQAKKREETRIRKQKRAIERADKPPKKHWRRRAPFAEVGRMGGAVSPHAKCIPCLASLGITRRRAERLFGISAGALKKYGFRAAQRHQIAALCHAAKKRKRIESGNLFTQRQIETIQMDDIKRDIDALRPVEYMWPAHHPEAKKWVGRKAAALTWQRFKDCPEFVLKKAARCRMWKLAKGMLKDTRTFEAIGCSIPHFRKWIEDRFQDGMSWDNYGDWEIDHVRPCASFDLTDRSQFLECFNYRNTRPMWRADNRRKWSSFNGVMFRKANWSKASL